MISSTQFLELRKDLEQRDAVTKTVTLNQIDVSPDGIKHGYIKVQGQTVPVARSFFAKLAKTVNVNTSLANSFMKNTSHKLHCAYLWIHQSYSKIFTLKKLVVRSN